ncbi:hypothetical protein Tco_0924576 [Tanacetum coccineum]|uniref:Uncharacterized protein n=1 Tax=Tanacetum coccineum TaxID=301880 RepID=A0ABQ5D704_9ASTR
MRKNQSFVIHEKSNASRNNATSSTTDERIDKHADQHSPLKRDVSKKFVTYPLLCKAYYETALLVGVSFLSNCPCLPISNSASVLSTTDTYNQVNPPNRVINPMEPTRFCLRWQNNGQNSKHTRKWCRPYEGPSIPTNPSPKKVVERETEETKDKEQTNFQRDSYTAPTAPLKSHPTGFLWIIPISILEPDVPKSLPKTTPILESDVPKSLPKPNNPYPSRRDDQKSRDKASNQWRRIYQIFLDLLSDASDLSYRDALLFGCQDLALRLRVCLE